jgi:hypothetical protein
MAVLAELDALTLRLRIGTNRLVRQLAELEATTYGRGVPAAAPVGQHEARRPRTRRSPGGHANQPATGTSSLPAARAG